MQSNGLNSPINELTMRILTLAEKNDNYSAENKWHFGISAHNISR
jgi:hypothetical protein